MVTAVTADLPGEQFGFLAAFLTVGFGNFDHFTMKIGRRKETEWYCLFKSQTMRAVNVEVEPKINTDSCLDAIMHFYTKRQFE